MTRRASRFLLAAAAAIEAEIARRKNDKFKRYFPDCTPRCKTASSKAEDHMNADGTQRFCRRLYRKHVFFMNCGSTYRERCMMAANRVGKSDLGAFETTVHLTGLYPHWWKGRRFEKEVSWWASGDTGKTTRNIIQEKLLGPPAAFGTGFIPKHLVVHRTRKAGIADAYETVWVKHASGGVSTLELKSYDQRREAFQGTCAFRLFIRPRRS